MVGTCATSLDMIPRYLKWLADHAGNIRYLDSAQIPQEYAEDFNDGMLTNSIVSFA